jgi:predicted GTPase
MCTIEKEGKTFIFLDSAGIRKKILIIRVLVHAPNRIT